MGMSHTNSDTPSSKKRVADKTYFNITTTTSQAFFDEFFKKISEGLALFIFTE